MTKKIAILLFFLFSFFTLGSIHISVNLKAEREERKIITSKNRDGVRHFGTNQFVMVPTEYEGLDAEMRGVWVATVYNIAISKQNGTSEKAIKEYQKEFLEILDRMEEYGMNTLFFQVRPANDAFYQSKLNPWSKFLVGEGVEPGWDPLRFMVEETHKRGFRFYCWMNAFRVTTESYVTSGKALTAKFEDIVRMKQEALNNLAKDNFARLHPEYVVAGLYDEKLILNPSEPMVQRFIVDTIMEIVENYDVDGLHFDDYFYLDGASSSNTENTCFVGYNGYTKDGADILNDMPNYLEYQKNPSSYGREAFGDGGIYGMEPGLTLGDFRRENINIMMRNIRQKIDAYNQRTKKRVEFGTKPAAVWRSNSEYCTPGSSRCVENGSNTAEGAYSTYNDLYADSLKWVQEGLVDWVAPQVYYSFEDAYAPYADIVDWWAEQVRIINEKRNQVGKKDIRLYIAHGIYKYRDNPDQFYRSAEIIDQLKYNNKYQDVLKGSAVYSYEILYKTLGSDIVSNYPNAEIIRKGAMKNFKNLWASSPIFPLAIGENDASNLALSDYQIIENSKGIVTIKFKTLEKACCYGYYKVKKGETFDSNNLANRQAVIYAGYEENKVVSIEIGELDETFDYYFIPVSVNGYLATEATKIDFSKKEMNVAPNPTDVVLELPNANEQLVGTTLKGYFLKPTDDNLDEVTYQIQLLEGNKKRKIDVLTEEIEDRIYFYWESYFYETDQLKIVVELSDGDLQTTCNSQEFQLVENYSPSQTEITTDKTEYNATETIKVNYTPLANYTSLIVYLVNNGIKTNVTKQFHQTSTGSSFEIELTGEYINDCFIEMQLKNGTKTTTSYSPTFRVLAFPITKVEISTEATSYEGESIIPIYYTSIDADCEVKVYFVTNTSKTDITNAFHQTKTGTLFMFTLPNEKEESCYIEFELTKKSTIKQFASNIFQIIQYTINDVAITTDATTYEGESTISIYYTPIDVDCEVKVYFVTDTSKTDITSEFNETKTGTFFTFTLPNENEESCYIEFELNKKSTTKWFTSDVFQIMQYTIHDVEITTETTYEAGSTISVHYTAIDVDCEVKVYLVTSTSKLDITNEFYQTKTGTFFTFTLPNENEESCYIEFELTKKSAIKQFRSNAFQIIQYMVNDVVITIDTTTYEAGSTISIHYTPIDVDCIVKVYLVTNTSKLDITNEFYQTKTETFFSLTLPNEAKDNCHIEFEITNHTCSKTFVSSPFCIEKANGKNCKKCQKSSIILIIQMITFVTIGIYAFRKRGIL